MESEFHSMMPHSVGITPYLSRDKWGKKTYGAIVLFRGRVENKRKMVTNYLGDEVVSQSTLYLATTSGIGIEDRITMPSGYLPANPDILAIERQDDEWGAHHTVIYV